MPVVMMPVRHIRPTVFAAVLLFFLTGGALLLTLSSTARADDSRDARLRVFPYRLSDPDRPYVEGSRTDEKQVERFWRAHRSRNFNAIKQCTSPDGVWLSGFWWPGATAKHTSGLVHLTKGELARDFAMRGPVYRGLQEGDFAAGFDLAGKLNFLHFKGEFPPRKKR